MHDLEPYFRLAIITCNYLERNHNCCPAGIFETQGGSIYTLKLITFIFNTLHHEQMDKCVLLNTSNLGLSLVTFLKAITIVVQAGFLETKVENIRRKRRTRMAISKNSKHTNF